MGFVSTPFHRFNCHYADCERIERGESGRSSISKEEIGVYILPRECFLYNVRPQEIYRSEREKSTVQYMAIGVFNGT